MVKKTHPDRRTFTGRVDPNVLQTQIEAIRERLQGDSPYALAGIAGKTRTKRPGRWKPKMRYVSVDSRTHREDDTRFNRP